MLTPARRHLRDDQSGFTIIEVTAVTGILLIVMAACFSTLVMLTRTERRTNALVSNEQEARQALTDLARDIRAANPLMPLPGVADGAISTYQSQLQVASSTGTTTLVRWVYDRATGSPTYRSLLRQTINPGNGAVLTSVVRLSNLRNAERTPAVPMFSYTSQSGLDLVAAGQAANVASCTLQVHIVITADSNPGPEPFTVNSDVQLRNRLPGGMGCG